MATKKNNYKPDDQQAIIEFLAEFTNDPLGFVYAAFPWGEGELIDFDGPDEWQKRILIAVRDKLINVSEAIQIAIASGHGIGKSCLVAWLILWAISTYEDTKGVVTANTENQLKTKTWAEVAKWYRLFIGKNLFTYTATALFSVDPEHEKTWRIDMSPWSERNTEAFAGLHNKGKRILIVFDEASAIPDVIWEVASGALSDADTQILWFAFGNPTRNTGRFRECFRKFRHRWINKQIDSRTVAMTNKTELNKMVDDYGEDSDIVKVRIRGQFPSSSDRQMISTALADAGRGRHLPVTAYQFAPKVIGVDPAWSGGDEIAITLRQGLAAKVLAIYEKNDNDFIIAGYVAYFEDKEEADAVIIDMGFGTGIYSAGKTMGRNWMLVSFSESSPDPAYLNIRAYGWAKMRDWLQEGGAYPDDQILYDDLIGPEYVMRDDGKIKLESKDDMKKRGLPSPNRGDSLAITFMRTVRKKQANSKPLTTNSNYNRFARR